MSDLFIGTSGYDYPEWKGVFYPDDLKHKDFLIFYATVQCTGADWQVATKDFKEALKPLNEKERLSSVLFQLPESFHYTNDNRIYLAKLIAEFEGFPVMI